MKIIKILKKEKEVDQKTYIIWTLPFFIYYMVLVFLTTGSRIDSFGVGLMEMEEATMNGLFFIIFGLLAFSMIWIFFLSAKRFVLFDQSPYTALWMIFIPAAPVIYIYLAFKKDLYYIKKRENM